MKTRKTQKKNSTLTPLLVVLLLTFIAAVGVYFLFFMKPHLVSLDIHHPLPVPYGGSRQLTATGHFSDHSSQDLSTMVIWTASDPDIAEIDTTAADKRLVTAVSPGTTTLTAKDPETGIRASTSVKVMNPKMISLAVTPPNATISLGGAHQVKAFGTFADGSTRDVTDAVRWLSANPEVAEFDWEAEIAGTVKTNGIGNAVIMAQDGESGVAGEAGLVVSAAVLTSLTLTPESTTVFKGETATFSAAGQFSDGSTRDITNTTTWSSSNPEIAQIISDGEQAGAVRTQKVGKTVITATTEGTSAQADLSVLEASLVSLKIIQRDTRLAQGNGKQFSVRSSYSDGSSHVLRRSIKWSSSNTNIAAFSTAPGKEGFLTTAAVGNATITARHSATDLSDAVTLIVGPAKLSAIKVSPSSLTLPLGKTHQLTATGKYTNGSSRDLTKTIQWHSSSESIAKMGATGETGNMVRTVAMGATTISATDSATGMRGVSRLTVTAPVLTKVALTADNSTIPIGGSTRLVATGTYSDGSTKPVSEQVQWRVSKEAVAAVSNEISSKGVVKAKSSGSVVVTAQDDISGIFATVVIRVTGATIVSVAIKPGTARIPEGGTMRLSAVATYTDGSEVDVTKEMTWTSSNTGVAAFTNRPGHPGEVKGIAIGKTTLAGTHTPTAKQRAAVLTVTRPVLSAITIEPQNPSIYLGRIQQFKALAVYSNGRTEDITKKAGWLSSDPTLSSVRDNPERKGLATALAVGKVTITATDPASRLTGTTTMHSRVDWK
jgi:hypothetical protein